MRTETRIDAEARKAILRGVNCVYEPVRRTLGPAGANALLFRTFNRGPRITNDGVTIAETVQPKDPFVKIVAEAFKEAAKRTNELAGDATTTTVVIGGHLINKTFKQLAEGPSVIGARKYSPMKMKNEMLLALDDVVKKIKEHTSPVKDLKTLEKIATVSVEDEQMGKMIAGMVFDIGGKGHIDVVEGFKGYIETDVIKGLRFPAKVPAKGFINNPDRHEMVAIDSHVLVTNYNLDNVREIGETINGFINGSNIKKLVIMAPKFSEQVLIELFAANKNGYAFLPVMVPALRTDQYEDVCTYFGATFVNKEAGKKIGSVLPSDLGFVDKLVVKDVEAREDATALGGKGSKTKAVEERIKTLESQARETKTPAHKKLLERRIAGMSSAVGVIRVGAPSQAEGLYKKLKIEDAVYACKAALEEGYVKGAGVMLSNIADELPENILTESLKAPYKQIQENAQEELKIGTSIIDPAKAIRLAVEHAVSVAAHLITVRIITPEIPDDNPADGYNNIANAIMAYTTMWGKREGLVKDGEDEAAREQLSRYEDMAANDNG